jgi:uncharacterized membrane protein
MGKRKPKSRLIEPRSRAETVFYIVAACIAMIGLSEATYLTVLHLTGDTAVCGGSASCSQVLGSNYAHVGQVPVAAFGALAYYLAFSCATFAAFGYARARIFFALTVGGMFLATLWLLFVQAFLLHAFCKYCLFSAAMIFLLAGIAVSRPAAD